MLLALKKRGFGAGLYNGVGGKIEEKESLMTAATRECEEEVGVKPLDLRVVAKLHFRGDDEMDVVVFLTDKWRGEISESEEMKPQWFKLDRLPLDKMWADDAIWLKRVLSGEKLTGYFTFKDGNLVDSRLTPDFDRGDIISVK